MIVVITTLVTRGMAALLQSSVELVEWSSEVKVYSVISPPPKKSLTTEKGLMLRKIFLIWEALPWAVAVWRCGVWPGSSLGFADVKV